MIAYYHEEHTSMRDLISRRDRDRAFAQAFICAFMLPPARLFRALGGSAGVALRARHRLDAVADIARF
jgi:hypothetical protein